MTANSLTTLFPVASSLSRPIITDTDSLVKALTEYPELAGMVLGYWEKEDGHRRMIVRELKNIKAELESAIAASKNSTTSPPAFTGISTRINESVKMVLQSGIAGGDRTSVTQAFGFVRDVFRLVEPYEPPNQPGFGLYFLYSLPFTVIHILDTLPDLQIIMSDVCPMSLFTSGTTFAESSYAWHSNPSLRNGYTDQIMTYLRYINIGKLCGVQKGKKKDRWGIWWGLPWERDNMKEEEAEREEFNSKDGKFTRRIKTREISVDGYYYGSFISSALITDLKSKPVVELGEKEGHGMIWMT